MKLLGIETSCDDTSICVVDGDPTDLSKKVDIHVFEKFSQEKLLEQWGGVVPEIAARNHLEKLVPLLKSSFETNDIDPKSIEAIAVTTVPGLLGPLLTGLNAAKTMAMLNQIPVIPVNHLYAHLEAIHIDQEVSYPYLGLLVSGGHSIFFLVESAYEFSVLGSTIDDAAGEAFDKGGRLLGLDYPSGQIIDQHSKNGNEKAYDFPIGLKSSADCRLSFSGLKTSLRVFLDSHPQIKEKIKDNNFDSEVCDVLASYQLAICDSLSLKLRYAIKKTGMPHIPVVVGGGVACNSRLRSRLKEKFPKQNFHFVTPKYCTDNGAMIANYGIRSFKNKIPYPQCMSLDARGRFISKTLDRDKHKVKEK